MPSSELAADWRLEACLIGGERVTGTEWIAVDNPATGAILGRVPRLGAEATDAAITAAAAAMPTWAARTASERGAVLRRIADLMRDHRESLARLLTEEQGKPLDEARGEISHAAAFFDWFAEEARRAYGEVIPSHDAGKRLMVLKQPVGVVAAITPWNFPAAMIARKVAPALAAGCAIVVKPAEQTPFSALAIGMIAEQAGLPSGLLNIVTGDPIAIGAAMTASPTVRKLSFTGSTAVGALLFAQSAATIKKLSLELGGNAPFIVFEDADLDAAVAGAITAKFRNAGQTCVCANRIYVQAGIHDAFVERLRVAIGRLVVGDGATEGVTLGPLIDDDALAKVDAHVADALAKGATLLAGGQRTKGRFYPPTLLAGATDTMLVTREETFGPLAPVIRFATEAEVFRAANSTPFGLAAYVYTRDLARTWRAAERIEAGMIGINTGLISTEVAPFGGIKSSGLGREGSRHGLDDFLELKYVCVAV